MIEKILNQAQKLFDRGFFIAAFIPSFIFTALTWYLLRGFDDLVMKVQTWVSQDWKQNFFALLLTLILVYLLAYIIYGVRTGVQQIYYGQWPFPFNFLTPIKLYFATRAMRRCRRRLERAEMALDDIIWIRKGEFEVFKSEDKLDDDQAKQLIDRVHKNLVSLDQRLDRRKEIKLRDERQCREVLRQAHRLQGNWHELPALRGAIDKLINEILTRYMKHELVFEAIIDRWHFKARRDLRETFNKFVNNFPADESWIHPTRLGNIAGTLEEYTLKRYGINLSDLWPRLVQVLPNNAKQRIEDANIYVDFTITTSALSLAAAFIAGICSYNQADRRPKLLLATIILSLSFWCFYQLAIQATRAFVIHLQASSDLFILKLTDFLEIQRPETLQEERELWKGLKTFVAQGEVPKQPIRFREYKEKSKTQTDKRAATRASAKPGKKTEDEDNQGEAETETNGDESFEDEAESDDNTCEDSVEDDDS